MKATEDLAPHFAAIARAIGVNDPAHKPEPRGVMQLISDLEESVDRAAESRFTLFVVKATDFEAIMALRRIAEIAKRAAGNRK